MFWPWFFWGGYCNNLMSLDCFVNRELLSIPSLLHRSKLWSYFPTLTQVDKWTCGPIQPKLRGFMALLCHRAMMDWYGLWWIRLTNQIFITQFIKYALACLVGIAVGCHTRSPQLIHGCARLVTLYGRNANFYIQYSKLSFLQVYCKCLSTTVI